jgi:hypothetical protein
VDDEQRYLDDYRAGKPYAVKRAAKSAATAVGLGLAILLTWVTDSSFPATPKEVYALVASPVMIAVGFWFLVDCVRRLGAGRRRSP